MKEISIGNKKIGKNNPAYIIAEIGLNHQGDINLAKQLIDCAAAAKVDCVKFQKRALEEVYKGDVLKNIEKEEHGSHYLLHHIIKSELSEADIKTLHRYSTSRGLDFICTAWDETSLKFLSKLNLPAYKIASADMFNLKLIEAAARYKKPLIISTGMSFISEIEQLVNFLKKQRVDYVLLHCNSTYPAPYQDLNLNYINALREKFDCLVGYSGHDQGITASLAAVTLGAKVVEKHLTLDRNLPGPDHKASLEPEEFKHLVSQIKVVEDSLGESVRYPSRGEYLNRETLSKSLVASRDLKQGRVLKAGDISIKSPGKGTSPLRYRDFIGKKLIKRDLKKDDYLLESDIDAGQLYQHSQRYSTEGVKRTWGVVARMVDIEEMLRLKPDFIEIHLTDSDINSSKVYTKSYDVDLVVHGPEYNGDLLLDLSSLNKKTRLQSISYFNKALAHARQLKSLFKNKNHPVKFIVHPGGMHMEKPLNDRKKELYVNLLDSLKKLKADGFELLLENMPGCPWYFGGQWFHASFMDADEIVKFSKKTGYGITFDTSHAALYCNYYGKDLTTYTRTIMPVTKYLHVSDAAKFNGEGLQIGDGSIDFKKIMPYLIAKDIWLLPEIWQGHKFGGEGFVKAISELKKISPNF